MTKVTYIFHGAKANAVTCSVFARFVLSRFWVFFNKGSSKTRNTLRNNPKKTTGAHLSEIIWPLSFVSFVLFLSPRLCLLEVPIRYQISLAEAARCAAESAVYTPYMHGPPRSQAGSQQPWAWALAATSSTDRSNGERPVGAKDAPV
jgi:hypothetical protein